MSEEHPRKNEDIARAIRKIGKYVTNHGTSTLPQEAWILDTLHLGVLDRHEDAQYLYRTVQSLPNLSPEWNSVLRSIVAIQDPATSSPFDVLVEMIKTLTKIAAHEPLWATKILTRNCFALASIAIKQSPFPASETDHANVMLDAAATTIRQAFRVTVTDFEGEEPQEGRTLECYSIGVCLFRLYVKMHAHSLAEGIMSAINSYAANIAPLSKSDPKVQVQFLFYKGMFAFYEQKYSVACKCLDLALQIPKPDSDGVQAVTPTQLEHIMVFLIPAKYLIENRTPSAALWDAVPRLKKLYKPLIDATRRGDYRSYLAHLEKQATTLRANRLFLACDLLIPRLRLNILRRCWMLLGRPKRIPIDSYAAALKVAGFSPPGVTNSDAAGFYMSQFILRGELKGYIHNELQLLMVSKTQPFPLLARPHAS